MKTIQTFYNPTVKGKRNTPWISVTSFFSWAVVLLILVLFWSGAAVVYKRDYVPHAIAKIEHKERKFLANHKTIQKKVIGFRNSLS